ncbi:Vegetative incompatibility protein HET-E-1 [Trametes pubescens]|uniref:Vegetative incompatibility protein HET-E-1 n=1 Tax=Trametes pubescens TaxID=154538 RepID=A0A1M2VWK7_TRAPU|nr:Vegetative incompatibility protein HET-E-1 [Trametes pubescens]
MPRFLNTWTGEFEWHNAPEKVPYAILSHTWRSPDKGGEQTYDDIRKLQADAAELRKGLHALTSTIPPESGPADVLPLIYHDRKLCDKIKSTCRIAREAGFRLVWIDSCCIDKTSSAELSEAINSMYEWYRLSDICYVYLEDVPNGEALESKESKFHTSRWHKRGWTLQELVAPERVVFVTETWRFLGTKIGLAHVLECITGIEFDILTHRAPLESVSVARRMSWNADRQTTRVEDRAYSLMGLFGVHMSPIYGEGHNAFLRLQEEIIRTIPDQSIFTWGHGCTLKSLSRTRPSHKSSIGRPGFHGLLAQSPNDFRDYGGVSVLSSTTFASRLGLENEDRVPPLHCIFTPEGVQARFLCVDLSRIPQLFRTFFAEVSIDVCERCMQLGHAHALALLQCEDVDDYLLALPLCKPRRSFGPELGLGLAIETHISCDDENVDHRPFRTIGLTINALKEALKHLSAEPIEVSLLRHYSPPPVPKSRQTHFALQRGINFWPKDRTEEVTFSVPPHCIENLGALGFTVSSLRYEPVERPGEIIVSITLLSDPEHRLWIKTPQQSIHIQFSLTLQEPRTRVPHWDIKIHFSVANRFVGLSESSTTQTDSPSTATSGVVSLNNSLASVAADSTQKDDHGTCRIE